jgi:hypothetical protein
MIFHQADKLDPELNDEMNADWFCSYNFSSKSRIQGLGKDGIAFCNTGQIQNEQDCGTAGYVGEAVLALKTIGVNNINVTWIGGFVSATGTSNRQYNLRLQYRIGNSGKFLDIPDSINNPVEYNYNGYLNNSSSKAHSQSFLTKIPSEAENQHSVQLRWKYYYDNIGTGSGSRPMLRLDDIFVQCDRNTHIKDVSFQNDFNLICPEIWHGSSTILEINSKSFTQLKIVMLNLLGSKIEDIYNGSLDEGYNKIEVTLKPEKFVPGVYILFISSPSLSLFKKILLYE